MPSAVLLSAGLKGSGQTLTPPTQTHKWIQNETNQIYDSLVAIRRDLHRHPEVSTREKRTAGIIEDYLRSLGLEVKTGIGGYGVVNDPGEAAEPIIPGREIFHRKVALVPSNAGKGLRQVQCPIQRGDYD